MTSSGSVPLSLSPNMVRNMVKLMGPGASAIIPSRYSSEGFLPEGRTSLLLMLGNISILLHYVDIRL